MTRIKVLFFLVLSSLTLFNPLYASGGCGSPESFGHMALRGALNTTLAGTILLSRNSGYLYPSISFAVPVATGLAASYLGTSFAVGLFAGEALVHSLLRTGNLCYNETAMIFSLLAVGVYLY